MKAVILPAHGGVEALQYTDFPEPLPGPGEVLVRLQAAGINRLDVWVRNGWPGIKLEYPHIPLAEVRRAHERLESGEQQGKLTLEIPD